MRESTKRPSKLNAWSVLSSLTFYTLRNFPLVVTSYLVLKLGEIAAQLAAAASVALIIQSTISGREALPSIGFIENLIGPNWVAIVANMPMSKFAFFVGIMLVLNAIFAYLARRMLSRCSIRIEENLAADVVATLKTLSYKRYQELLINHDFDQRFALRLIQQNTRLAGIAGRNLLSAVFTLSLLVLVFSILFLLDHRTAYIAFGSLFFSVIALVMVFRFGMRHSEEFPASIPPATFSRSQFLDAALSGNAIKGARIRSKYLQSEPINRSLRHYENRFKILDFGELVTASVTTIAFILIVSLFAIDQSNKLTGVEILTPFVIVTILFIGNLLFQSLRRTSTLIIAIGRLYEQVWELWEYRTSAIRFERGSTGNAIGQAKPIGKFRQHVNLHRSDITLPQLGGGILAVCQHTPVNRLGLFKLLADCIDLDPINSSVFDKVLSTDLTDFYEYWDSIKPARQKWLVDRFISVVNSIDVEGGTSPHMNVEVLKPAKSFQLFVFMQQHSGVLLFPMAILKDFPQDFFELLRDRAKCLLIVVMGRSPAQGIRGYEKIIPFVLLNGKVSMTLDTEAACLLPGLSLQSILKPADLNNKRMQDVGVGEVI